MLCAMQKAESTRKELAILDAKRSNMINIGLTVLPPPNTIKAAILKMDSAIMNREGIEVSLLTWSDTLGFQGICTRSFYVPAQNAIKS